MHSLDPKKASVAVKTFNDYANLVFVPHILRHLQYVKRLDVVWDCYRPDSLKSYTRHCRGDGDSLRVADNTSIPGNWTSFLRVDSNKTGLFKFLSAAVYSANVPPDKILLTTNEEHVLSPSPVDLTHLQPCTQEEADYRMMLHMTDAYHHGQRKIMIHATDTDVLVLAIATASSLNDCEIWLAFGHGKNFRYIAVHDIAAHLGGERSKALLFLHVISGCDNVSAMCGIGKKTVWEAWRHMPHLDALFTRLSNAPAEINEDDMNEIERFVVVLYSRTSHLSKVNEARRQLFAHGNRQLENIPPTRAALFQHVKRAAYQAGHIWGQAQIKDTSPPSPSDWGWEKTAEDGGWTPTWTTLPEASKSCRELVKCNCKKSYLGRCKCFKSNLKCTQLCFCAGQCVQGHQVD